MTQPHSEITGVRSLIAHLRAVASASAASGGDEAFIGSLNRMEVGAGDIALVQAAQEAGRNASAAWGAAERSVAANNMPVHEAYSASPDAANKHANTNE